MMKLPDLFYSSSMMFLFACYAYIFLMSLYGWSGTTIDYT